MSNTKIMLGFLALVALAAVLMATPALFNMDASRTDMPELIAWSSDLNQALGVAGDSGKLVLVDFTADWCGPCQEMKREVFTQRSVADAVDAGFVPVQVDLTAPNDAQQALATRYGVQFIPTLLILTADGEVALKQVGALDSGGMLRWLESAPRPIAQGATEGV